MDRRKDRRCENITFVECTMNLWGINPSIDLCYPYQKPDGPSQSSPTRAEVMITGMPNVALSKMQSYFPYVIILLKTTVAKAETAVIITKIPCDVANVWNRIRSLTQQKRYSKYDKTNIPSNLEKLTRKMFLFRSLLLFQYSLLNRSISKST